MSLWRPLGVKQATCLGRALWLYLGLIMGWL